MLGIIIEAESNTGDFPNKIFHKFGNKTALERIITSAQNSDHPHKVILSMPNTDRGMIGGSVFQSRLITATHTSKYQRQLDTNFYGPFNERLTRLYHTALTFRLDHIVRIKANNFLIPTWMINGIIEKYYECGASKVVHTWDNYPKGFQLSVLPFWRLAKLHIDATNQDGFDQYLLNIEDKITFQNEGEVELPIVKNANGEKISFALENVSQVQMLSRITEELDMGADIGSLLEDFSE